MAFVISKKETRKIRVNIDESGDFAEVKHHTADIEFRLLSKSDIEYIQDLTKEFLDDSRTEKNAAYDANLAIDLMFDAIVNVDGLKDLSGNAIDYNDDVKQFLKETNWASLPILQAFWAIQGGVSQNDLYKAIKAKN